MSYRGIFVTPFNIVEIENIRITLERCWDRMEEKFRKEKENSIFGSFFFFQILESVRRVESLENLSSREILFTDFYYACNYQFYYSIFPRKKMQEARGKINSFYIEI